MVPATDCAVQDSQKWSVSHVRQLGQWMHVHETGVHRCVLVEVLRIFMEEG